MSEAVETEPWEALRAYVGAGSVDDEFVRECWERAVTLVNQFVGAATVPDEILSLACVHTGSELYARKDAPSGIQGWSDGTMNPVRLARDPMSGAYPLLRRFVGWGIG